MRSGAVGAHHEDPWLDALRLKSLRVFPGVVGETVMDVGFAGGLRDQRTRMRSCSLPASGPANNRKPSSARPFMNAACSLTAGCSKAPFPSVQPGPASRVTANRLIDAPFRCFAGDGRLGQSTPDRRPARRVRVVDLFSGACRLDGPCRRLVDDSVGVAVCGHGGVERVARSQSAASSRSPTIQPIRPSTKLVRVVGVVAEPHPRSRAFELDRR